MASSVVGAIIASAVIGAASAAYQGKQQEKASEADRNRREAAAKAERDRADLIASETKPEEEALGETKFGADDGRGAFGSASDFLIPKTSALGGGKGRSGLGFAL